MTIVGNPTRSLTPTGVAARVLLRRTVPWMLASFGAIAGIYALITGSVITLGSPDASIWASSGWVLQWLAFGGGIALGSSLPVLVAHGLSRRTVAVAAVVVLVILTAGMAVLMEAGLAIERAGFRAAGISYTVDASHLFRGIGEVHLVIAEFGGMFAGFLVSGWLVWIGYYRAGWWRGTLAVPLGFLPAVGVLAALSAGYAGPVDAGSPAWLATMGAPPAVALALAAVGVGLAGVWTMTRTAPVR